jgi:hypothetical protein
MGSRLVGRSRRYLFPPPFESEDDGDERLRYPVRDKVESMG